MDADVEQLTDGRRRRRELGRLAVVDAMIDLVLERGTAPSAVDVAARAEVSQASLYRYFATLEDLRSEAIGRYFQRFADVMEIPRIGEGTLRARVDRFVTARDAFYARTAPMARLVRRQASDVPEFAANLERLRATLVDQVTHHFATELASLRVPARRHRAAVIAACTSFEAWDQLAPLGEPARRAALRSALTDLLTV